jgi:hypothetical protein
VRFTISCEYVTEVLGKKDGRLVIEVSGPVTWKPWDDSAQVSDLQQLIDHEPEILGAQVSGESVVVNLLLRKTSGGVLTLPAKDSTIQWADGDELGFSALAEATRTYWKKWRDKQRPK